MATWRKLAKQVKAIARTGVISVNPDTGASGRERNHRFTAGAKALERVGIPMLAFAGGAQYRFDD